MSGNEPPTISAFMTEDHRRCDTLYADLENAAINEDTEQAKDLGQRFLESMAHHFEMEEKILFPAFEERTGMRQGPTMVMRMEHDQMRNLLGSLEQAAKAGNLDGILKAGGTLLFVMQQHNVKEEQMLYAMVDAHLGSEADTLIATMQAL